MHPVMITVSECSTTSCSLLSAYPKLPFLLVTLAVAPTCFTVAAQFCFMRITNMKNLKKNCTNKCLIPTKYMTIYFLFFFFFFYFTPCPRAHQKKSKLQQKEETNNNSKLSRKTAHLGHTAPPGGESTELLCNLNIFTVADTEVTTRGSVCNTHWKATF